MLQTIFSRLEHNESGIFGLYEQPHSSVSVCHRIIIHRSDLMTFVETKNYNYDSFFGLQTTSILVKIHRGCVTEQLMRVHRHTLGFCTLLNIHMVLTCLAFMVVPHEMAAILSFVC